MTKQKRVITVIFCLVVNFASMRLRRCAIVIEALFRVSLTKAVISLGLVSFGKWNLVRLKRMSNDFMRFLGNAFSLEFTSFQLTGHYLPIFSNAQLESRGGFCRL